jgi:hypothetical protein
MHGQNQEKPMREQQQNCTPLLDAQCFQALTQR